MELLIYTLLSIYLSTPSLRGLEELRDGPNVLKRLCGAPFPGGDDVRGEDRVRIHHAPQLPALHRRVRQVLVDERQDDHRLYGPKRELEVRL